MVQFVEEASSSDVFVYQSLPWICLYTILNFISSYYVRTCSHMTASDQIESVWEHAPISPRLIHGMWQYFCLPSAAMRSKSVLLYSAACGCSPAQALCACIWLAYGAITGPTVSHILWVHPFSAHKMGFWYIFLCIFFNINKYVYESDLIWLNLLQILEK